MVPPKSGLDALIVALLLLASLAGCARTAPLIHDGKWHPAGFRSGRDRPAGVVPNVWDHVIAVDGQGVPHDPRTPDGRALSMCGFRRQIASVFLAMRRFHEGRPNRRVLIFVHGGLTSVESSLALADDEIERVMDAGYYPIFLNWNSDLIDTYGEHVTKLTQGRTDESVIRKLLSPLYVLADAGRALSRAPVVWSNQIGTDISAASADVQALP